MAEPEPSATRRRRRRGTTAPPAEQSTPAQQSTSTQQSRSAEQCPAEPRAAEPQPQPQSASQRSKPRPKARGESADRGLRGLVGAGPSQLGVSGALRGRDVNRPSEQDLAEAERDVVLVRRNWKPPP
ncbi:hypothetical protein M6B22_04995 [Jatrophihabitans cynanchi]|jgi:hypothetical protein|uniref:Uncharacterized protein n=1 Tax=Jatrophihabitans cynanchi TaxID=2944128 RepID=A0ABY7K4C8_9ACTN|nr:hypothetical protein [Jatrophihabitans sp. SB3-54]WAX58126.1 hypothetical protein M6B22_04995 [Jatrophihabitans sp. SB3-54]